MSLLMAFALLGASQDSTVFGIGLESCATAMQPRREIERRAYILGFWSGMNGANGKSVGRKTDALGAIGEVELYCQRNPSEALVQATYDTYKKLEIEGR